jgi:hypothetical protein
MSQLRTVLLVAAAAFLASSSASRAATLLSEGFDDISALPGDGWVLTNASTPPGAVDGWFQGNSGIFNAQAGAPEAYVASNFNVAGAGGTLANWLITPVFSTAAAGSVTFWVRGAAEPDYDDYIAYGFSSGSSATTDFTMTPVLTALAGEWQEYTVSFAAGGAGSTARFAIEHSEAADLSNYIGVDSLAVTTGVSAVPEPSIWAMMLLGFAGVGAMAYRRRSWSRVDVVGAKERIAGEATY